MSNFVTNRMARAVAAIAMVCCVARSAPSQAQLPALTAAVRKQTIEDLATLVAERYTYKDTAAELATLLRTKLRAGQYDRYSTPADLAKAVTTDLRSLRPDAHLALRFDPEEKRAPGQPASPALSADERARQVSAFNRQMNYGFKAIQFFPGNVCALKFDYFDAFLAYSGPVVDAALGSLVNCDAVILDLRENGGGSGEMVERIARVFFRERTLIGTSYDRLTDTSSDEYIDPAPPEQRLSADVFVVTSHVTMSAAEGLAYMLKYARKAVVVGEVSAGAANPGRITRLNPIFSAFIPNRHGQSAITKTNWEGTGVPVDVAAPAEDALRVARLEALKHLQQRARTPEDRQKLASYITYLEAVHAKPRFTLEPYVGAYEDGHTVLLRDGELYYVRGGDGGDRMQAIAPDTFMVSEGDTTIVFQRDTRGAVVGLESRWSLRPVPTKAARIH